MKDTVSGRALHEARAMGGLDHLRRSPERHVLLMSNNFFKK
jgi:hypothetical protein